MAKYKKRKDGRYAAQIIVGYTSDGKKIVKTVYDKNPRVLDDKIAEIRAEIRGGVFVSDKILLCDWAREWIKLYKSNKAHNTYQQYNQAVNFIISELGHYYLKDLKTHHIQNVLNKLIEEDKLRTAELRLLAIKQMLKQAILNDYLAKNVAEGVSLPEKRASTKRALTKNEEKCILALDLPPQEKLFLFLLYYTGMRRGEILALNYNDIDFNNNVIHVNKNVVFDKNEGILSDKTKTDAGIRSVPLLQELAKVLKEYNSNQLYLFEKNGKFPFTCSTYRRFWERIINKIDNKLSEETLNPNYKSGITPHIFRHNFATILYNAGVDVKQAQQILGHKSILVTLDVYTHLDSQGQAQAYDKLSSFIGNGQSLDSQNISKAL